MELPTIQVTDKTGTRKGTFIINECDFNDKEHKRVKPSRVVLESSKSDGSDEEGGGEE